MSREAGVKFFRFNAGLAAILIAVAFAFRPAGDDAGVVGRAWRSSRSSCAEAAVVLYWATVGRTLASIRPAIVGGRVRRRRRRARRCRRSTSSPAGALPMQALTVASFLSSAALLGGACTAMILGHWYLVIPSMQVSHLQSIVKVHIASMVVRVVVVGAAVFVAIATWQPGLGPSFRHYITVGRRHLLLAARAVRPRRAGAAVVSHLGDGEDPLDAVGDRHSLRRFLHRRRRRGAGEVPAPRDARARVVQ